VCWQVGTVFGGAFGTLAAKTGHDWRSLSKEVVEWTQLWRMQERRRFPPETWCPSVLEMSKSAKNVAPVALSSGGRVECIGDDKTPELRSKSLGTRNSAVWNKLQCSQRQT
jgi:hypothetical protein